MDMVTKETTEKPRKAVSSNTNRFRRKTAYDPAMALLFLFLLGHGLFRKTTYTSPCFRV
jgi:hypothetical protein